MMVDTIKRWIFPLEVFHIDSTPDKCNCKAKKRVDLKKKLLSIVAVV